MRNIKLKNARLRLHYTQSQVAKQANVTIVAYQNYEANRKTPNVRIAIRIAKILDTTVEELFETGEK